MLRLTSRFGLRAIAGGVMLFIVSVISPIGAQQAAQGSRLRRDEIIAGSDREHLFVDRYVRRATIPIGVRPFGALVLDSLFSVDDDLFTDRRRARMERASSWSALWFNTQRAYNDGGGPVWRGRGLTFAASTGFTGRWGLVSYAFRPISFWTENRLYVPSRTIKPVGFQDPWLAGSIDLPYRFGQTGYGRIDVGESYLRIDTRFLAFGLSNASQVWGPARRYPLVLGNNAGGFPHVFLETGTPRPIGIGRVHARWVAGRLASSSFGPAHEGTSGRMGIGAVATFLPRSVDGLEIGATRFFHLYDSPIARDFESLTLPFSGLLKRGLRNPDAADFRQYNQVASVFARIAPQFSPVALHGEFYREDHSVDVRDLVGQPDHISAYLLGFVRTWLGKSGGKSRILTMEVANSRISHLERVRGQGAAYTHAPVFEGHTLRGMTLGSPAVPGGGAISAQFEQRSQQGSWSFLGEVVKRAQTSEGGTVDGVATGYCMIGFGRELQAGRQRWSSQIQLQPGFGDVPGTNILLLLRLSG